MTRISKQKNLVQSVGQHIILETDSQMEKGSKSDLSQVDAAKRRFSGSGKDFNSGESNDPKRIRSVKSGEFGRQSIADGIPISIDIPEEPDDLENIKNKYHRNKSIRNGDHRPQFSSMLLSPSGRPNLDNGDITEPQQDGFEFDEDFTDKKRRRFSQKHERDPN